LLGLDVEANADEETGGAEVAVLGDVPLLEGPGVGRFCTVSGAFIRPEHDKQSATEIPRIRLKVPRYCSRLG
jgi:hypothetical protein